MTDAAAWTKGRPGSADPAQLPCVRANIERRIRVAARCCLGRLITLIPSTEVARQVDVVGGGGQRLARTLVLSQRVVKAVQRRLARCFAVVVAYLPGETTQGREFLSCALSVA